MQASSFKIRGEPCKNYLSYLPLRGVFIPCDERYYVCHAYEFLVAVAISIWGLSNVLKFADQGTLELFQNPWRASKNYLS